MLRATSHTHATDDEPFGTVVLDHTERHLRRKLITTSQGDKVTVDLPEAILFQDGDRLVLEDGRTVEIIAAKEKLYVVTPGQGVPLRHIAWHLGNRHLAAQIDEDRILIQRDHVIRAMLEGLGASVSETVDRFQPVHGAYHQHGSHATAHAHSDAGHAHSHAHAESHSASSSTHSHHHASAHHGGVPQDQRSNQGKPDRFGRLPGDPHYGHNHG